MNTRSLHKNHGVSLVELMIVLAILGILMGFVVPNYGMMMAKRSLTAETMRVIGVLKLARSEARARGATVTASRPSSGDWSDQIMLYESTVLAGNSPYVAGTGPNRDDLIKNISTTNRNVTVRDNISSNGEFISFNLRGWLSSGETQAILIAVCVPSLEVAEGKYIEINRVGKIRERPIGTATGGCL